MLAAIQNHHRNLLGDETLPVRQSRLIELAGVTKAYEVGAGKFLALKGIDMQVDEGEFIAVVGKSGSGKSTLTRPMQFPPLMRTPQPCPLGTQMQSVL